MKKNSKELEIKLINVSKIKVISDMFKDCRALISIDKISEKKILSYMYLSNMFNNCSSLISIKLDIKANGTKIMKNLFQVAHHLKVYLIF